MNIHLPKYKILKESIWDKKYLQPIVDVIDIILIKYKNKEDYIQDILDLRILILDCDNKLHKYYIVDDIQNHFIRLIEMTVSDDMRYLLFTIYKDVIDNNTLDDVPNVIIFEYAIFREIYLNRNIISKYYGKDITEINYLKTISLSNLDDKDYENYIVEKHYPLIRYLLLNYLDNDSTSQLIVNSIYDFQVELIEMCLNTVSVEDTFYYTHPSYEFFLYLKHSVFKHIQPLFYEILGIELQVSSEDITPIHYK